MHRYGCLLGWPLLQAYVLDRPPALALCHACCAPHQSATQYYSKGQQSKSNLLSIKRFGRAHPRQLTVRTQQRLTRARNGGLYGKESLNLLGPLHRKQRCHAHNLEIVQPELFCRLADGNDAGGADSGGDADGSDAGGANDDGGADDGDDGDDARVNSVSNGG